MGWSKHVAKHKREFCRAIGRMEGEAWRINWEDVVLYFNPKEAKKKHTDYPQPKEIRKLTNWCKE